MYFYSLKVGEINVKIFGRVWEPMGSGLETKPE